MIVSETKETKSIPKEFKYNPYASYKTIPNNKLKKDINLINQTIFVNQKDNFKVTFPDLFQKYQNPTIHTNEPWNTWKHSSFDWWQCQLNFAIWCASTGCGVSYDDHILMSSRSSRSSQSSGLIKSLYTFHLYNCTARILKELGSPLPTDPSFCYYKNPYNLSVYQKICKEFGVSLNEDWRQKMEPSSYG